MGVPADTCLFCSKIVSVYLTHCMLSVTTCTIFTCRTYVQHSSHLYQQWNKPEILHILSNCLKLNTTEQYEIYNHYKQSSTNIVYDQLHYKSHTFFDTATHPSHTNISDITTTMNRKQRHPSQFHRDRQALKIAHIAPKTSAKISSK